MIKISEVIMKTLIFTMLFCLASSVSADSLIHDMKANDFVSNGATKIEHSVFSGSLTVNGPADIYHSKLKFGTINGSLIAHGIDAHAITISGSALISAKSDVQQLHVNGILNINDSYLDLVTINGPVHGNGAYIKKISVNDGDLDFINSDLGKVYVNHGAGRSTAVTIRLLGKTIVRHLTIDGPLAIIVLDNESKKTFDKSIVTSNGKVEYK